MTRQEFDETKFWSGMQITYKGLTYDTETVDFEERTIGLIDANEGIVIDIPCEECELVLLNM